MAHAGSRVAPAALVALFVCGLAGPAGAATSRIPLPRPVDDVPVLSGVGLATDRLLLSRTPGPVANREAVTVGVGPDGTPAAVTVEQRLSVEGTGDYQIRERGPARRVEGLGDTVPPVLKLGTVVWQGFSPGHRDLAARLTLDPGLEAPRLPLAISLQFTARDGRRAALGPGGAVPGAGTITVTLRNATTAPVTVPLARADPRAAAGALQTLLDAARRPPTGRPPTAGNGLPGSLPGVATGEETLEAVAPLRVTGVLRMPGTAARVQGPGTTRLPDGARVVGTLRDQVAFAVTAPAAGRLEVDLTVQPWLDPRPLLPPAPSRTWPAWAAGRPDGSAQLAATHTLLSEAANAARAAEYTPYLDASLTGAKATTYRYVVAAVAAKAGAVAGLTPRPGAIAAAGLAALLIAANLGLLWRSL